MKFDFEALFESRESPVPGPAVRTSESRGGVRGYPRASLPEPAQPSLTAQLNEAGRLSMTQPAQPPPPTRSQTFQALNRRSLVENAARPRAVNLGDEAIRDRVAQALAERVARKPEFVAGRPCLRFANCLYVGDSADGAAFGVGLAWFDNMDVYVGHFRANQFDGRGFYFSHKGGFVFAEFAGGLAHGQVFWSNHRAESGVGRAEAGRLAQTSVKTDRQATLLLRAKGPLPGDSPAPQSAGPGTPPPAPLGVSTASTLHDLSQFDTLGFFEASNALFRGIRAARTRRAEPQTFESFVRECDGDAAEFVKRPIDYSRFVCAQRAFLGNVATGVGSAFLRDGETYHGRFENNQLVRVGLMSRLDGVVEFGALAHGLKGAKAVLGGLGKRFYPDLEVTATGFFEADGLSGNFVLEHVSGGHWAFVHFQDSRVAREFFKADGPVSWRYLWERLGPLLAAELGPRCSDQSGREVSQDFLMADLVRKRGERGGCAPPAEHALHDEILVYFLDRLVGVPVEPGVVNSRNRIEDFEPVLARLESRMAVPAPAAPVDKLTSELEEHFAALGPQALVGMRGSSQSREGASGRGRDDSGSFTRHGNQFSMSLFDSFTDHTEAQAQAQTVFVKSKVSNLQGAPPAPPAPSPPAPTPLAPQVPQGPQLHQSRDSFVVLSLSELRETDPETFQKVTEVLGVKEEGPRQLERRLEAKPTIEISDLEGKPRPSGVRVAAGAPRASPQIGPAPGQRPDDGDQLVLNLSELETTNPELHARLVEVYNLKPAPARPAPIPKVQAPAQPNTVRVLSRNLPVDPHLYTHFAAILPTTAMGTPDVFSGVLHMTAPVSSPRPSSLRKTQTPPKPVRTPDPPAEERSATQPISYAALSQTKRRRSLLGKPGPYSAQLQQRPKR